MLHDELDHLVFFTASHCLNHPPTQAPLFGNVGAALSHLYKVIELMRLEFKIDCTFTMMVVPQCLVVKCVSAIFK